MCQRFLKIVLSHVVLAGADVNVCEEEVRLHKLIRELRVVRHFSDTLELGRGKVGEQQPGRVSGRRRQRK